MYVYKSNKYRKRDISLIVISFQEDGEVSEIGLQMALLKHVAPEKCSRLHGDYKLTKDMFCLYGEGERDVCQGDSGGAVLWNKWDTCHFFDQQKDLA